MELPEGSEKIAAAFKDLPDNRKQEIVAHIAATPEDRGNATVTQLIDNGGPEGRFVAAIFGKNAPTKGAAPQNKSLGAPETK